MNTLYLEFLALVMLSALVWTLAVAGLFTLL
jgi:hypothetical protein